MSKANFKLTIAYDGTGYLGWQKTKTGPSIEQTLEDVLCRILQQPISLQAASRTDAGVHAHGQVVNFFSEKETLDLGKLRFSLNSVLPKDIAVLEADTMPETFHPTLDCKSKEYHYSICHAKVQMPPQRLYAWHFPYDLDTHAMREAIPEIVGKRDFSAFCNVKKNEEYADYVRELFSIEIIELRNKDLKVVLKGNSFLYKMVRNIVGTLVYIGCGKLTIADLTKIIASGDRTLAGVTAPAHGLFLHRVNY